MLIRFVRSIRRHWYDVLIMGNSRPRSFFVFIDYWKKKIKILETVSNFGHRGLSFQRKSPIKQETGEQRKAVLSRGGQRQALSLCLFPPPRYMGPGNGIAPEFSLISHPPRRHLRTILLFLIFYIQTKGREALRFRASKKSFTTNNMIEETKPKKGSFWYSVWEFFISDEHTRTCNNLTRCPSIQDTPSMFWSCFYQAGWILKNKSFIFNGKKWVLSNITSFFHLPRKMFWVKPEIKTISLTHSNTSV